MINFCSVFSNCFIALNGTQPAAIKLMHDAICKASIHQLDTKVLLQVSFLNF